MHPEILSLPFTRDEYGCSKDGARHALPNAQSQAMKVLTAIRDHQPVSDADLVQLTGLPISTICARRWQLCKQGHIHAVGKRMGRCGVETTVYIVTDPRDE